MIPTKISLDQKYRSIWGYLNERQKRLLAAAEARSLGYGGVTQVSRSLGLSRATIHHGLKELEDLDKGKKLEGDVRQPGAGRKKITEVDPKMIKELIKIMSPTKKADAPLEWTCMSTRQLSDLLKERGHPISHTKVSQLLNLLGYHLQVNTKTHEGGTQVERDAQFSHISDVVRAAQKRGATILAIETRKRELESVTPTVLEDESIPSLNDAAQPPILHEVEIGDRQWVGVSIDHQTASFAVECVRNWWKMHADPEDQEILLIADTGGKQGFRAKMWRVEMQRLSDETAFDIDICHLPPGTSKWTQVDQTTSYQMTTSGPDEPVAHHDVVIRQLSTKKKRRTGRNLSQKEEEIESALRHLNLSQDQFQGSWNYTIRPH